MGVTRRILATAMIAMVACGWGLVAAAAQPDTAQAQKVLSNWYTLMLALVRHTPTYSPPVASRSFAYVGVTVFEIVASGSGDVTSLAGQLHGLKAVPQREAGKTYDDAMALEAALAFAAENFFGNTGPTGQRAMAALEAKLRADVMAGLSPDVASRSQAYGQAVAAHILAWSQSDGGAVITNLGFPSKYKLIAGPAHWLPTNLIALQQTPLLPDWGKNRTFVLPTNTTCSLPPPPAYSEDKASEFYKQALEIVDMKRNLTPEQRTIARVWADDAMLSTTPPGHWISIVLQIFERDRTSLETRAEILALLGVGLADAFIGCWQTKYQYDLVRPISYIRRVFDPAWDSALNTPPFPEYPSGHSTQSGVAATVLTKLLGDHFAFEDATYLKEGLKPRDYASFWAAADEAAVSRLYGGIHFRAAIERGLDQGRCIGAFVNALHTRR